jgi:glycosyltransferase involved in cell wall biosynthesis
MTESSAAKRLTYIVNYLSADDAQHFVHIPNLLLEMEKIGWEIELVSERGGKGTAEVLGRRVTFLSQRSKWKRAVGLVGYLIAMRRRGGRLVFIRISKFAALVSALLGRILGWRTVFWISGTLEDFNLRRGLPARFGLAGMWLLFRLVDRLATGPETMVHYYSARYHLPERKIMLLYNDVDLAPVTVATPLDEGLRVLLVHRLSPVRETHRYLPALLRVLGRHAQQAGSPIVLDICGDGPERPLLERIVRAAASQVEVHFHGAVPQRQLGEYYGQASIFVMPSYREGFPRVMIEAMSHGLPIVATDAGGTRDLCGPAQQAYVVDREDAQAFGMAVERLLASSEERRQLRQENLESVKRFSTPEVARMYDAAFSALIGQPQ